MPLRCQTPANAMPPSCTAQAGGRIRYVTGPFAPQTNTFRSVPYAPLELYLMGLAPASEVPPSIQMLTAAKVVSSDTKSVVVEASGVTTLAFSSITARHGTPRMLPASERHFGTAFVVVSAAPADDSVLSGVADFAAAFGKRKVIAGWSSFEEHTGGRATMDTTLHARRAAGTAVPTPRKPLTCDTIAQDCSRPELGCYMAPPAVCALSGGVAAGKPCDAVFACAPGLDCVSGPSSPTTYVCKPYCDPNDGSSASACAKLCPVNHLTFKDAGGTVVAGLFQPD